jgi:hypothetical protein
VVGHQQEGFFLPMRLANQRSTWGLRSTSEASVSQCTTARADPELADLGDQRVAVPTMWGPLAAALAPEDFGGDCGTRR